MNKIKKKPPKPDEINAPKSDVILLFFFGRKLLSTLGPPPPKSQKQKQNASSRKKTPNLYEIHVPNPYWIVLDQPKDFF